MKNSSEDDEEVDNGGRSGEFSAFTSFFLHGILCVSASIPYLFYVFFTLRYKSLFQPKNIFKSNFAFRYNVTNSS
jgi:hypothetical protein